MEYLNYLLQIIAIVIALFEVADFLAIFGFDCLISVFYGLESVFYNSLIGK